MGWTGRKGRRSRDDLISRAREGAITSAEAESEAAAHGWEPFQQQPALPKFDPMSEPRWSLVMTIAWIAWRDLSLVREQNAGFRSECTHWIFREWKMPGDKQSRPGWFLEPWSKATVPRLSMTDTLLNSRSELPATRQMSVQAAERRLWEALGEGRLTAQALDPRGLPVDIPERDWSYLKLFEAREQDVLKYTGRDSEPAFTDIKIKRESVFGIWPPAAYQPADLTDKFVIDPTMIEPVASPGSSGFVPLCSALHWIATKGGTLSVMLDDDVAWERACDSLLPLIHEGQVEILGLRPGAPFPEKIPGHTLALIKVVRPLNLGFDQILSNPAHIACAAFCNRKQWEDGINDQLYLKGAGAAWTHLQVPKSDLLKWWPRPESKAKPELDCYR
jgi:hypothetical protein